MEKQPTKHTKPAKSQAIKGATGIRAYPKTSVFEMGCPI
jgi:hypothetical protein